MRAIASATTRPSFLARSVFFRNSHCIGRTAIAAITSLMDSRMSPTMFQCTGVVQAVASVGTARWMAVCCTTGQDYDGIELQIKIDGMVCDGCSSRVQEALEQTAGVKSVEVSLEKGVATLSLEAATQMDAFNEFPKLIEVIKELGFDAEPYFS